MDEFAFDLTTEAGVQSAITGLYVSILGRAPDPNGLDFWTGEFNAGVSGGKTPEQTLNDIAESFRANATADPANPFSDDAAAVLNAESSDDVTDAQVGAFLNQWFQNSVGRDYDPEGADAGLNGAATLTAALDDDDGASIGDALVTLLNAVASGDDNDAAVVNNRIAQGIDFQGGVEDPDNLPEDFFEQADQLNDTTGAPSGPDLTVQVVDAANTGPFDATGDDFRFDIASGSFSAEISGFDEGDVLNAFEGAGITVQPDDDQADGAQVITFADSDAGTVAEVTLSGLTAQQDGGLFNESSITDVFGAGALGADVDDGDDDMTGDDGDDDMTGDDGDDDMTGDDGDGGVDSTQAVDAAGTFDAAGENVEFDIASGAFAATIENFDSGDVLDGFEGASITVDNQDGTDGQAQLNFADGDAGTVAEITLTGLSEAQDSGLFNESSITSVFGDGALI